MTPAANILLADTRATLLADANKARGRRDVAEAAVIWALSEKNAPTEVKALADEAALCRGQARTYRQIAILGFAASASVSLFEHQQELEAGAAWLFGIPTANAGTVHGFAADPVAMLGIALGLQRLSQALQTTGKAWLSQFVPHSYEVSASDAFAACLWAAVQRLADFLPELTTPDTDAVADVRVGLRSKGLMQATQDVVEKDEQTSLQLLIAGIDVDVDPVRAALRVAALDWVRRTASAALPARMTAEDVVTILKRVEFALKRWTWEDKAKTKTGTARQWNMDNEYHVQNLLWMILAPLFPDLTDEEYTIQLGSKNPRADIGIPSLRLIVEAKFMRDSASPKEMIEQIAQDASLYLVPGSRYSEIIAFIWDDAARTNQHDEMVRAMKQIDGVFNAVVVSRPGNWV